MLIHFVLAGALLLGRSDSYFSEERSPEESKMQPPTVVVAIIARNGAHSLPYYLGALERLDYPKDRISLWWVPVFPALSLFIRALYLRFEPGSRCFLGGSNELEAAAASRRSKRPLSAFHSARLTSY